MEQQTSDETRAAKQVKYQKEKKERARKKKAEEKAKQKAKHPEKPLRRDWAALKASLVFDEKGVGRTPDGNWMYFPAAGPASEKALLAGHAEERTRLMYMGFVEEVEGARETMPSSDEEGEGEGEGGEEKGEDVEIGGMGGVAGMVLE